MNLAELRALGLVETRECRYGRMSFLRTDQWIAQCLGYYGEFSEAEVDVWRTFLRPGDNVVSAGSNIGAHVVFFARHVGPEGRVITVEPQEALYEILTENIAQNGLGNVEHRRAGLGRAAGQTGIAAIDYRYSYNFGSIATAGASALGDAAVVVDMVTIDELVAGRPMRLLQLDVEGHELDALQGAVTTIRTSRPYLYLEADRPAQREPLLKMLGMLGYEALFHEAPLYNPRNYDKRGLNVFGNTVSLSLLGIPKGGV